MGKLWTPRKKNFFMWRFRKSNGITKEVHRKMKLIQN